MIYSIYHNPRCRKSRETLSLLSDHSDSIEVIEYLNNVPSRTELKAIIKKLGISAEQLLRKGEDDFKTHFKGKDLSKDEWIDAMISYPKLIERPIVVKGDKAIIGKPPENVMKLF